jgi:DNA-binding Xre family transcriptional regulator
MSRWADFVRQIDAEAAAEGPQAVAELQAFHAYFRLARRFAERRRHLELTQAELAERSGIAQSEISRFESGRANPTFLTLSRLCAALECEVALVAHEAAPPDGAGPPAR